MGEGNPRIHSHSIALELGLGHFIANELQDMAMRLMYRLTLRMKAHEGPLGHSCNNLRLRSCHLPLLPHLPSPLWRLAGHASQLKGSPAPCDYSSPYWLCSSLKLNKMHPIECTAHKRIFIWILSTDKASPGIISRAHLQDLIARSSCSQFLSQHSSWKYFLSEGKAPLCWFIIIIILDLKSSLSSVITSSV